MVYQPPSMHTQGADYVRLNTHRKFDKFGSFTQLYYYRQSQLSALLLIGIGLRTHSATSN